jgi:hypothetical protein
VCVCVCVAGCGADCNGTLCRSIVDGPQAAMIVGEMKVIVDCYWRSTKQVDTAQLYNLTVSPFL